MLLLTSTSDLLQLVTSTAAAVEVHASFVDKLGDVITGDRKNTNVAAAATTTVVGSPAASTQRNVQTLIVRNVDPTLSCVCTLRHTDGTTVSRLIVATLLAGESLQFVDGEGWRLIRTDGSVSVTFTPLDRVLTLTVDGGGSQITTGVKGYIQIPWNCTIKSWTLLGDQSGNVQFDIWKDTYANFPPTVADTITASAKPNLVSQQKNTNATLTGWTVAINEGDVLGFNVDSSSGGLLRVTLQLTLRI